MAIDSVYIKIGYMEFEAKDIKRDVFNEFINEFLYRAIKKRLDDDPRKIRWIAEEVIGSFYFNPNTFQYTHTGMNPNMPPLQNITITTTAPSSSQWIV